jgi:hypothetical protein
MHIPTGYSQVNLRFTGISIPTGAECVFGVQPGNPPTNPIDIANAVNTALINSVFSGMYTSDATISSILVKNGPVDTGPFAVLTTTRTGTNGADSNVPQVATLVRKGTAFGGRSGRGRMFIPSPVASGFDDAGVIDPSFLAGANIIVDDFLTELDTAGVPMVLLHTNPVLTPYTVTSLTVDTRAATQRRRLRR